MYCKNCGKKLPDNARFCDRCNMSVRKIEDKKNRIVELKEERLARRQAKAVEERFKKIKKVKNKRYKNIALVVALVVLAGALSVFLGWFMINPQKDNIKDGTLREEETVAPTKAPTIVTGSTSVPVSATSGPTDAPTGGSPVTLNSDGYYVADLGGMSIAYPRGFADYESDTVNQLSLYDVAGDAVLVAGKTVTGLQPKDLMERYYSNIGGTVMESRATGDDYEISINTGTQIRHRKSCVKDGAEFYYEINYPASSANRQQYIEDIEYMDTFFTNK